MTKKVKVTVLKNKPLTEEQSMKLAKDMLKQNPGIPGIKTSSCLPSNKYRIFGNEDGDWFVAAKMENGKITILHEGHSRAQAYEEILRDMGFVFNIEDRNMDTGTYAPVKADFE